MAISTFSKFYFGTEITLTTNRIDIDEGAGELSGTLDLGVYSLTGLAIALEQELNAIGLNAYTVSFNRETRVFNITADAAFDLLIANGTNQGNGCYSVFGFTGTSDLTGQTSYVADTPAGSEYVTQFPPQSYVAPNFRKEKGDASVNVSASGIVEVISFGDISFVEMDLLYITNITMDGTVIRSNATGVEDTIDFLTFATKRGPIEFMPDKDDSNTFYQCNLESTSEDRNGTKFKLAEETGKNLPGVYKTGKLVFRILE